MKRKQLIFFSPIFSSKREVASLSESLLFPTVWDAVCMPVHVYLCGFVQGTRPENAKGDSTSSGHVCAGQRPEHNLSVPDLPVTACLCPSHPTLRYYHAATIKLLTAGQ